MEIGLGGHHLTVLTISLFGVTPIVFPSIIDTLIENLVGIGIGILIVLGAIFAPLCLANRNKDKNGITKNDQETSKQNSKTSDGGSFFGGDFASGDGGGGGR